jgi:transcriptional regulator with XRE-family HTH domain
MNNPAPITANGVPELSIADRLLVARRHSGLDTRQFAERTGISKATINNYENRDYPRARKPLYLKAWAMGAGVSYTWLATGQEPGGPGGASDLRQDGFACINTPRQARGAVVIQLEQRAA